MPVGQHHPRPRQADQVGQADEADQAAPANPAARSGLVLPDACSDLIWEQGVGAYVAGPDTGPARPMIKAGTVIVGVRFRPSAGGQVLKTPLSEIANQRVPLADLLPPAARRLPPALDPEEAADRVLAITGALVVDGTPDPAMARAAVLLRDPAARAEAVAAEVGLSERQFRRRSQAAAGYGPKTLQRVLRFHRFVRLLDAAPGPAPPAPPAPYAPPAPPVPGRARAARPGRPRRSSRLRRPGSPHPRVLRAVRPHPRQAGPGQGRATARDRERQQR